MASRPLAGLKVVDLTTVVLGPYCTQILADLGAEVVKVESPEGDSTRWIGAARHEGMSGIFLNLNRNKRSIGLDLKQTDGREILLSLVRKADIFIHSMRPKAIERLGLGWDHLRPLNPRLIYCVVAGYGSGGGHSGKPAYDDVIQAMSGLAELQRGEREAPQYCATVVADKVAGLSAVYGILAAVIQRHSTGLGEIVEVPMFETLSAFVLVEHIGGRAFRPSIGPASYARITTPHRRPYRTRDGYIAVIVYTDAHWKSLLEIIGEPDLMADKRFATFTERARHVDYLYEFLANALSRRTTHEWLDVLCQHDIPATPVLSTDQLFSEPHLLESRFFEFQQHPSEGALCLPRQPVKLGSGDADSTRPAPLLGEHSSEILREVNFPQDEVDDLVRRRIVIVPPAAPGNRSNLPISPPRTADSEEGEEKSERT